MKNETEWTISNFNFKLSNIKKGTTVKTTVELVGFNERNPDLTLTRKVGPDDENKVTQELIEMGLDPVFIPSISYNATALKTAVLTSNTKAKSYQKSFAKVIEEEAENKKKKAKSEAEARKQADSDAALEAKILAGNEADPNEDTFDLEEESEEDYDYTSEDEPDLASVRSTHKATPL